VIVVDDGSTDRSLEVCAEHLQGVDAKFIRQENAGLSAARNEGIYTASGKYLMFLDADDFLLPNALKNILDILEREEPDVLFGRYLRWTPLFGYIPSKQYDYNPPDDLKKRTEYIIGQLPEPSWNAWRYICRRKVLLERELFFERGILCEDVPWSVSLLENVDTISFLAEPFYAYYQQRPDSIMSRMNPKRIVDLNTIIYDLLKKYKDRPNLYRSLVWQSFFYINEYCRFDKNERKQILESYRSVLYLYRYSGSLLHRIVGYCSNSFLFYGISMCMYAIKCTRRLLKYRVEPFKITNKAEKLLVDSTTEEKALN